MTAGVTSRNTIPKALMPGVKRWYGAAYEQHTKFDEQLFEILSSDKAFEEDVEVTGFGLAQVKSEAGPSSYDSMTQGATSRYTHVAYSLGFIVTREEIADNQYEKLAEMRAKALAFSFYTTRQTIAANVINNWTTSGFVGGDGVVLLSNAHPSLAGNQSNILATPADFSETALEDCLKLMMIAKNNRGLQIPLLPKKLFGHTDYAFDMTRVLRSQLRVGTPNNDINAIKSMGLFNGDPVLNPFFTDRDAWGIITNAPNGMTCYNREVDEPKRDNDFDTDNLKVKKYERFSYGWTDWRGVYGSQGA